MLRATLALFIRSMRVDARFARMHLFRLLFVCLIYFSLILNQSYGGYFGAPGLNFFKAISSLNFFFITLAGVSFFSTAITEEKEEMTLGLLRIAGIQPPALIIGKSTPRLIAAILLLSVQFPFTLLAITLGGVTMQQVLSVYTALLAYLILVANLGLFFSVLCLRSRSASLLTGIVLAVFFFSPLLLIASISMLEYYGWISSNDFIYRLGNSLSANLSAASAYTRIGTIMMSGFSQSILTFQVYSNVVASLLFFGLSWIFFNLFNRSEKPVLQSQPIRLGLPWKNRRRNSDRAWEWALTWKDFHYIAGGYKMVIIKFVLYGLIIPLDLFLRIAFDSTYSINFYDTAGTLMGTMLFMLFIESSFFASRLFNDEIRSNTLSSISLLPLSTPELAYTKLVGCLLGLVPVLTYLVLGFLTYLLYFPYPEYGQVVSSNFEPEVFLVFSAMFFFFILFLHVVSFLSLLIKWGAIPLALALTYGSFITFLPFTFLLFRSDPEVGLFFLNVFIIIATLLLHRGIASRLKLLAGR